MGIISISFDFETSAQSPVTSFKARVKNNILNLTNLIKITDKDLSGGFGRGYGNRAGADIILKIFDKFNIKATWFCTGHVLLKENKNKNAYRINQKLEYATEKAGFSQAVTWRSKFNSFYHEPYSNYIKHPYYYLGDLASKIKQNGHDIQCHSFSHPYISMEPVENIKLDLEDWQNTAEKNGFKKATIFAFPFMGDFHLIEKSTGAKIIPAYVKPYKEYEKFYLKDEVIQIFKKNGFELFTRCGSLINYKLNSFMPYRNSSVYCMKDIGLLSFKNVEGFNYFIDELVNNKANIDLWLHPNDILDKNNFKKFISFIEILVNYRDSGKISLCTIKEQWDQYKEMNGIKF